MYRHDLICSQSARLVCGYVYANAGEGESTQDLVFGGQNIIAENGTCLVESDVLSTRAYVPTWIWNAWTVNAGA